MHLEHFSLLFIKLVKKHVLTGKNYFFLDKKNILGSNMLYSFGVSHLICGNRNYFKFYFSNIDPSIGDLDPSNCCWWRLAR